MSRYHQRVPIVDPDNPQSWGRDDITGLPVMHTDMVKYYEYMGTGLQWTGFMTHYKDLDQPNPQLVPPRLRPDPVPIDNPRYLTFTEAPPQVTNLIAQTVTSNSVTLIWDDIPGIPQYNLVLSASFLPTNVNYSSNTNSLTINGLLSSATYYVAVASVYISVIPTSNGETQTITSQSALGGNPADINNPISFVTLP